MNENRNDWGKFRRICWLILWAIDVIINAAFFSRMQSILIKWCNVSSRMLVVVVRVIFDFLWVARCQEDFLFLIVLFLGYRKHMECCMRVSTHTHASTYTYENAYLSQSFVSNYILMRGKMRWFSSTTWKKWTKSPLVRCLQPIGKFAWENAAIFFHTEIRYCLLTTIVSVVYSILFS